MTTVKEYFVQAELSLATYGTFSIGAIDPNQLTNPDVGMSSAQAAAFAAAYTVVDQYTDPASGFSATVFEGGGERYLAIRGTENWLDYIADADLALSGAAAKQTIALFNYIQRLSGVKGQPVAQLEWIGQDYVLNQTSAVGLLDTPLTGALSITGHSLGGHLAMAFGRLFPQATSQIYTFNAPGFVDAAADSSSRATRSIKPKIGWQAIFWLEADSRWRRRSPTPPDFIWKYCMPIPGRTSPSPATLWAAA